MKWVLILLDGVERKGTETLDLTCARRLEGGGVASSSDSELEFRSDGCKLFNSLSHSMKESSSLSVSCLTHESMIILAILAVWQLGRHDKEVLGISSAIPT